MAEPIAPGLFSWPADRPQLLGSRCRDCRIVAFPAQASCQACGSDQVEIEALPDRGTLWTWTIQRFMPKVPYDRGESAESFVPYGVGYIELPGAVRVESRLTENDPDKLQIGMQMQLVFEQYKTAAGKDVIGFAFSPVANDASGEEHHD